MKRYLKIIAGMVIVTCFLIPVALQADDTEIYGTVGVSLKPNVLIIFDTSGSMGTVDVVSEVYDPATTYSGSYPTNAVYRKSYSGWIKLADNVETICSGAKDLLLVDGYCRYKVNQYTGACGGNRRDLRIGNYMNYEESGLGTKSSRISVAKSVIKSLITSTSDVRFGLMRFNHDQGGRIVEECGASISDLETAIDALTASGYTPLAETLAEAGLYFAGMSSWYNSGVSYATPMEERCQKNYIILMTDGEPTYDSDSKLSSGSYINGDTIGDYDGDGKERFSSTDYLDDVAKYLYANDCNTTMGTGTSFERQNIITYTIGFKTEQQLLQDTAMNGGGTYYTAQNISGLNEAFQEIMANISEQNAVFVSPVVPVSRMNRVYAGNYIYVGFFKPQQAGRWLGNLKKYGLDSNGDLIDADGTAATLADGRIVDNARSYWSLTADGSNVAAGGTGGVLLDQTTRYLYTYTGYVGGNQSALTHSENAFTTSNSLITNAVLGVSSDTERTSLINDIYGGSRFWYLGDILHSEPAVVHYSSESYIYTGSNDGMMHCFVDSTGRELWGFIPPDQLNRLSLLLNNDHDYFVDGSPVVYYGSSQKILFFGERRGGDHYYALDITTPTSPSWLYKVSSDILGGGDALLGQSWCKANVGTIKTSTSTSSDVFILAGGYDTNQDIETPATTDTVGRAVFAVKVTDGSVSSLNFNKGNFTSMDHSIVDVTGFDTKSDGYIDAVYAGDLGGDVFAFEDHNGDGTWSGRKLFSASAVDSVQRKMFYAPDAVIESFGEMVFIGTGDRADPSETAVVNRLYAIKNSWEDTATFTTLTESNLIDVTANRIQLGSAGEKAAAKTALETSDGWYIRLENTGEKVTASPTVYGGVVYFTTYTPDTSGATSSSDPCGDSGARGTARLYAVNYLTGGAVHDYSSISETDPDGNVVDRGKLDRCKTIGTAIPSAPVIAILESGAKMYIGVEGGIAPEDPVATLDANVFYWRQIF